MTETPLTQKKCRACEGGVKPLDKKAAIEYLAQVPEWQMTDNSKGIYRVYKMKNFMAAVNLIRSMAELAENDNHHPDIHLTGYRNLRVDLSTHAIGGLSENDFILAAKFDQLPAELKK